MIDRVDPLVGVGRFLSTPATLFAGVDQADPRIGSTSMTRMTVFYKRPGTTDGGQQDFLTHGSTGWRIGILRVAGVDRVWTRYSDGAAAQISVALPNQVPAGVRIHGTSYNGTTALAWLDDGTTVSVAAGTPGYTVPTTALVIGALSAAGASAGNLAVMVATLMTDVVALSLAEMAQVGANIAANMAVGYDFTDVFDDVTGRPSDLVYYDARDIVTPGTPPLVGASWAARTGAGVALTRVGSPEAYGLLGKV